MKHPCWSVSAALLLLTGFAIGQARAEEAPPSEITVIKLPLPTGSETQPVKILTNPNEATAVEFPYAIEVPAGRGFTQSPADTAGDFLLSAKRGENFFFVTPLLDDARRTLHVVLQGGRIVSIEFVPAPRELAFRHVTFVDTAAFKAAQEQAGRAVRDQRTDVTRSRTPPRGGYKDASPDLQYGLVRTAQMFANFSPERAVKAVGANSALMLNIRDDQTYRAKGAGDGRVLTLGSRVTLRPTDKLDYGDFTITTHFVLRNEVIDAVCFAVTVQNNTASVLTFEPDSFTVRSGGFPYATQTVDFSPSIKPGESNAAFLVVTRTMEGKANRLAPEGDFRISLNSATAANPKPVMNLDLNKEGNANGGR